MISLKNFFKTNTNGVGDKHSKKPVIDEQSIQYDEISCSKFCQKYHGGIVSFDNEVSINQSSLIGDDKD